MDDSIVARIHVKNNVLRRSRGDFGLREGGTTSLISQALSATVFSKPRVGAGPRLIAKFYRSAQSLRRLASLQFQFAERTDFRDATGPIRDRQSMFRVDSLELPSSRDSRANVE